MTPPGNPGKRKFRQKTQAMRFATSLLTTLAMLLGGILTTGATTPQGDFSFTTRDGRPTSLYAEIGRLQPDARVWLLLFDPDCEDCRELEERLEADPVIAAGLADKTTSVIAVYPTSEVPEPDDPNLASYLRACEILPAEWVVGIDNGSIFETDACTWDSLPLLFEFRADEIANNQNQ